MKWTLFFLATGALAAHQHHRRQDSAITTESTPGLDSTTTVDGGDATADATLQIASAKLSGSGCPQGSAVAEISQQLQSVNVVLPASFRAEKGGNMKQKDATKNLQIQVLYPAGAAVPRWCRRTLPGASS